MFFKKPKTKAGEELKKIKEIKKECASFEMYKKTGGNAEVFLKTKQEWEEEFLTFVDPTVLYYDSKKELKKDYARYKKEIDIIFENKIRELKEKEKQEIKELEQLEQEHEERLERAREQKENISYNNSEECFSYLNKEFDKILSDDKNN